jgi:hypothetical protein
VIRPLASTRALTNRTVVSGVGEKGWLAPVFSGYLFKGRFQWVGARLAAVRSDITAGSQSAG